MDGAVLSGVASFANMIQQSKINSDNILNQNRLLEKQQQFQKNENLNMYRNLRSSLEKAGMNVNSAFGGYPTTSSPSSPLAQLQSSPVDAVGIGQLLQQSQLNESQVEKNKAEADKAKAEALKVGEDTKTSQLNNIMLDFENSKLQEKYDIFMNHQLAEIGKLTAETDYTELKLTYQDLENKYEVAAFDDKLTLLKETIAKIQADRNLTNEQKKTEVARQTLAYANAAESRAKVKEIFALLDAKWNLLKAQEQNQREQSFTEFDKRQLLGIQALMVKTEQEWVDYQNLLKTFGVPVANIIKIGRALGFGK